MKHIHKFITCVLLMAGCNTGVIFAQQDTTTTKTEISATTIEKSKELLNSLGLSESLKNTIPNMLDNYKQMLPMLSDEFVAKAKNEFVTKYYPILMEGVEKIFAKHFTQEELNEGVNFLQGDFGKRLSSALMSAMKDYGKEAVEGGSVDDFPSLEKYMSEEDMKKVNEFENSAFMKKVKTDSKSLSDDISQLGQQIAIEMTNSLLNE